VVIAIRRVLIFDLLFLVLCALGFGFLPSNRVVTYGRTSFLVRVRRCLAPSDMTDLLFQKGEQIRQVGKASALASVAFEGCSPDQFTLAPDLPQAQQVR
jgi:hypothetical protein